ncbi:MAG TPA: MXAN_5187 family protein [Kofleriaceae bacterium]|nr:MXAN_5187 family protein [Kofleriaceae bacterium]
MFWSKIWLFLLTLAGAAALTAALLLPRPAQRALVRGEVNRLQTACSVIHILLADDARNRIDLAGAFARSPEIMNALESASSVPQLDESRMKQVRDVGETVMKAIQGSRKPDFAMLMDRRGRVVARVRLDDGDFGDVAVGRPLIDDALAGYLRDDVWVQNGSLFFVSAAPVIKQGSYVGAVVLGHQVTNQLAQTLVKSIDVDMGFHLGGDGIAGSRTIAFDHSPLQAAIGKLGDDVTTDCQQVRPIDVHAGDADYTAIAARLPGEAAARQAFYSVMIRRPEGLGFVGTLRAIKDSDLSFGSFPWLIVGGAFVIVLGLGIGLMLLEVDRPLRRLAGDAVRLAKGDTDRLTEDIHGGKFGSIARSVNIQIDKLGRDARSARKDLDQLLGPAPEGSLGTIDLLATSLPTARPGGPAPAVPPPPSEFRFTESGSQPAYKPAARAAPPVPNTPPPVRTAAPPAPPVMAPPQFGLAPERSERSAVRSPDRMPERPPERLAERSSPLPPERPSATFDDDILGRGTGEMQSRVEPYFKQIFDQFVSVKRSCNEPVTGLVYERFAEKLVKNREDLMLKTGCRDVRFTVYIKDGKAALKATPVKDEA